MDGSDYSCDEVKTITLDHLDEVRHKITDLGTLEKVLQEMASQCDKGAVPACPIIDALFDEQKKTPG